MSHPRGDFYRRVLESLLGDGVLRRDMTVLVTCGGAADREALQAAGLHDVTITNIDETGGGEAVAPFAWERQDAEDLSYGDGSFDVGIVAAGLHHCRSPHRALLELYRVARVVAIAIESRDSALMRLSVRLGAADEYELGAVAAHGLQAGGVRHSQTPNYVYRWTEREVEKTVASYAPHARHRVHWFRELEVPAEALDAPGLRGRLVRLAVPVVRGLTRVVPSQTNLFAFAIEKPQLPRDLQPWMAAADEPDERVIRGRYAVER